ncbi:ABC transporter permease [Parapedobacter sp. 10938]|uniref:ABC transporter permease n=1 Tax=Parapedobacter flavus TaxID=3110225 RepID=UPI002DC02E43|nr:ABC transporter permease [Parapedobacter sp. 10938]MEC3879761.1 ABC transporter permease [Parapedobacter sp. 10938]
MLKHYFKTALRAIFRDKIHSFINIGGLAISMSVVILITLWMQTELNFDRYHRDAERLYLLSTYDAEEGKLGESSPYAAYPALKEQLPEVELAAAACKSIFFPLVAVGSDRFYEHDALYIDSNWVRIFDYELQEGSLDIFSQSVNQIAISRTKARQYFGDGPALGQSIRLDSTQVIIGAVFADIPPNSSFRQDVLIPNHILFKSDYYGGIDNWSVRSQWVVVKLHPSANPALAAEKATTIFRNNQSDQEGAPSHQALVPITDLHLHQGFIAPDLPKGNKHTIGVFTLLGALLLLAGCVNFINLSISRATLRTKEVGIRKVAGAGQHQLFIQSMAENILAITLSMGLTVIMVVALLPQFNAQFETHLAFSLFDVRTIMTVVLVFLIVMVLTGIYPALLVGNISPLQLFRGKGAFRIGNTALRKSLLVGQLVLAIGMIISVLVIEQQFRYIQRQASAYQMDQVFSFTAASPDIMLRGNQQQRIEAHRQKLQTIKSDLLSSSAIKGVTRVNGVSLIDNPRSRDTYFQWLGYPPTDNPPKAVTLSIDHDYLSLASIQVRSGRWFDPTNVSDKNNIVINETAIKAFGLKEPVVGTNFDESGFRQGTIIGVVKDFHHASLHHPIQPVVLELDQHGMGHKLLVEAYAGRTEDAVDAAADVWKNHYPNKPFEYLFLDAEFDRLYKADQRALVISLTFALLSLLISCLGILGMAMFSAQRRVKEIGIRKVLGATVSGIVAMLSAGFVKMALIAFVIASPVAWWATNRWLEDFAYRIAVPWWVFAVAGLAGVMIALLTVSWQAITAASANPTDALRDD